MTLACVVAGIDFTLSKMKRLNGCNLGLPSSKPLPQAFLMINGAISLHSWCLKTILPAFVPGHKLQCAYMTTGTGNVLDFLHISMSFDHAFYLYMVLYFLLRKHNSKFRRSLKKGQKIFQRDHHVLCGKLWDMTYDFKYFCPFRGRQKRGVLVRPVIYSGWEQGSCFSSCAVHRSVVMCLKLSVTWYPRIICSLTGTSTPPARHTGTPGVIQYTSTHSHIQAHTHMKRYREMVSCLAGTLAKCIQISIVTILTVVNVIAS